MTILGGLDIATTTGLSRCVGDVITSSSFRPSAKRPAGLKPGEVDFRHEAKVVREFRDHLRTWLIDSGIQAVAIEKPLVPNLTIKKPIIDAQPNFGGQAIRYESKGGTTFGTIFRIYALVGCALEVCDRLSIQIYVVPQQSWRSSFMGVTRAPKGTENGSAWLKGKSKETCERLGIVIANADQADAAGIVFWLRAYLNPRLGNVRDDLFNAAGKGAL